MNETTRRPDATSDWNTYWQGSAQSVAFAAEGVNHPLVEQFWRTFFADAVTTFESPRIIDIASGKGAVTETAVGSFGENGATYECLDVSEHAITAVVQRFPFVQGHVADAGNLQLDKGAYDIVASQFGIEYAGADAIKGAAALVAAGGSLVLMMHHRESSIYTECSRNLEGTLELQQSRLIDLARNMFEAGYAALRGKGSVDAYNNATRAVIPAMRAMEELTDRLGTDIAGGSVAQLYEEIANIQEDLRHYDDQEVIDWLDSMRREMQAYAGRMQSMCSAAVSAETVNETIGWLRGNGFDAHADAVVDEIDRPLAWTITARR